MYNFHGNLAIADFDLVLFEIDVFPFPPADYQCSTPAVGSDWHLRDAAAQSERWLCRATVSLSDSGQMYVGFSEFCLNQEKKKKKKSEWT